LQAFEIVAMRVPPTAAGTLLVQPVGIASPKDGDERDAAFDQPPRRQQAHPVDVFSIPLTDRFGLLRNVKRLVRPGPQQ
jgi:hypothetical protein